VICDAVTQPVRARKGPSAGDPSFTHFCAARAFASVKKLIGTRSDWQDLDGRRLSSTYLAVLIDRLSPSIEHFFVWPRICTSRFSMDPLTAAAANGLQASMDSFDMLANNLANSSTAGFKGDREFYSTYLAPDADDAFNSSVGVSPLVQKQWTDFSQGTLVNTGNPTDLALSGAGFFAVNGPSGTLYTRNGNFHLSAQRQLVTAEGYPVRLTGNQTLQAQSGSPLQVGTDGQILQDGNPLGQLELASFKDSSQLQRSAGVYFQNVDAPANPVTPSAAQIFQGKNESSNATPAESAARMISLMRHFEMLQHAIKVGTEMNRQAVEEVAKVGS
jgi:flagellar basal-body rod protein FlgF